MPPKNPTAKGSVKQPAGKSGAVKPAAAPGRAGGRPTPAGKAAANKKTSTAGSTKSTGAGAKKTGNASGRGSTTNKGKQPQTTKQERTWTPQDDAARKIQTKVRQFFAKKMVEKRKKEKEDYEEMMDKLEREAYVKIVKMQQEEAERQRQKEEEERKKKREEVKRRKRMLEAAFDGEIDEIRNILKEVSQLDDKDKIGTDVIGRAVRAKHLFKMVECEDANNNTPLSEASSGGHVETIKFLIERGADPNSRGHFQRTPLYRAAFAGHLDACQILLQYGADPRLYADDGQTPEQVGSQQAVVELLSSWDMEQTERLLSKLEAAKERRAEEERQRREAETSKLEEQVKIAESEYKLRQKQLCKMTEELNKRILEHDLAVGSGFDRPEVTLQAIHDAEADLEIAKIDIEKARDKLAQVKLQLREQQMEGEEDDLPGLKVTIRELDDVLVKDVGNRIAESGKWPLIIDTSGQAATFLRYRDTNYINALSPQQMEADKIRLAVLGALRYGKPVVLDMMEVDMFETCAMKFDDAHKDLLDFIMDKSIMQEEKYLKMVKDTDGDEYQKTRFNSLRTQNFKFIIVTKNPFPPETLLEATYPIRIHMPA